MTEMGHEFFEHVRQDHDELREILRKVHHALSERTGSRQEISTLIEELTQHVERHFADEERSGFFENAVAEAPRYSDRATALKEEHQALRSQLAKIGDLIQATSDDDAWWKALNDEVHEFSKSLMHHENGENELLQDVYDEDVGSKD